MTRFGHTSRSKDVDDDDDDDDDDENLTRFDRKCYDYVTISSQQQQQQINLTSKPACIFVRSPSSVLLY